MGKKVFFHESISELTALKRIFSSIKCNEIDLWPSIAPSVYVWHSKKSLGSSWFKFLRKIKYLFFLEKFQPSGNGDILASFLIDRQNHHELWSLALSSFNKNDLTLIDSFRGGKKGIFPILKRFSLRFPNLVEIYQISKELNSLGLNKIVREKSDRDYLVLQTYFNKRKIRYLSNLVNNVKPKAYLAYSSYRNNDETIITQLMKEKKKPTFTMQNYNLSEFNSFDSESITYENFISDYFLLWGESGFNVMKKFIPKEKLLIVGNPVYKKIKPKKKGKETPKVCTVFLDHFNYEKSNFELINIVKEFAKSNPDIKFQFNIHIDNDREPYIKEIKGKNLIVLGKTSGKAQLSKLFKDSDLVILHNTTIALEALEYQIPILRLKDKKSYFLDIPKYEFSDLNSLDKLFRKVSLEDKYSKEAYNFYMKNFFQPKKLTIPQKYKKEILKRVN